MPGADAAVAGGTPDLDARMAESAVRRGGGRCELVLSVPGIRCGACMRAIESGLAAAPGITEVRVNLSLRRVRVVWREGITTAVSVLQALEALGFEAHIPDPDREAAGDDARYRQLLLALAVAGFAAGNIMMMSIAVWSGADSSTRDLFHWLSALIAVPAVAIAGRPFFSGAVAALAVRRITMDVPISLAVILAVLLSLVETAGSGPHAYFDAAVGLLFFLLIGRTLDHLMRRRARSAATLLSRLAPDRTLRVGPEDAVEDVAVREVRPGDILLLRSGDRIPVDGEVIEGPVRIDAGIVTGESSLMTGETGHPLSAGMLNAGDGFRMRAARTASRSFVAEITRLMEAAEGTRARYRQLSEKAAGIYVPAVHAVAAATFVGWWLASGDPWLAASIAIAVLIITCPCALALAVPMVHVVAAGQMFRSGLLLRDGAALERLAEISHVVLDKTGTLTTGVVRVANPGTIGTDALALAAGLAQTSSHPKSRAICALARARGAARTVPGQPVEHVGLGIELATGEGVLRLGRAGWAGAGEGATVLGRDGTVLAAFEFEEVLRPGAAASAHALRAAGLGVEILSGDRPDKVACVAAAVGVADWKGGVRPEEKLARLAELGRRGEQVLMVGDGLNDGPSLSAAHASMAPSGACDVGRSAADLVFLGESLAVVPFAIDLASRARALMRQNLGLAVLYNLIAVPVAVAGLATPLVAAIAMSLSSVLVTANALRLSSRRLPAAPREGE